MIAEATNIEKIISLNEISHYLQKHREKGEKIVQCHGVFDLLHPGHIKHFKEAKKQGDILVVSVTKDCFVNKGPGRPVFTEILRMETISALSVVDYVVLSPSPDAITCIKAIQPDVYIKGPDYKNQKDDITGKITEEANAVKENGGIIYFTDDIVFSSSSLLNRFFDPLPPGVQKFLQPIKQKYTAKELISSLDDLSKLKVLVIGDAIIDDYQFVEMLGQAGKGTHMSVKLLDNEVFLGGSLIIANHLADFTKEVSLVASLGNQEMHSKFLQRDMKENVNSYFVPSTEEKTLTKKRFVIKDGKTLTKLFETYSSNEPILDDHNTEKICNYLIEKSKEVDLVLVADFGNGFTNPQIINTLCSLPNFLALNTQTNSGNRGYNVVTHYRRADYICVNEPEMRLASHNKQSSLEGITQDIADIMHAKYISVTRGVNGMHCYSENQSIDVPAFSLSSIDRIGAGDSFLALSALALAGKLPIEIACFFGSLAASMSVQAIGNSTVEKIDLCKYINRLFK